MEPITFCMRDAHGESNRSYMKRRSVAHYYFLHDVAHVKIIRDGYGRQSGTHG
jgi:hypothetical protein